MESQDEPWLDAYGLFLQVDAQIEVVKMLSQESSTAPLDADILRRIHPILAVSHQRYGRWVLLDTLLSDMLWERPGNEPTAIAMLSSLLSLRASLLRIKEDEPPRKINFDTNAEGRSRQGSATQRLDYPPDESENRMGDEGDREYRAGFPGQHRRAAANRSRPRPW
jgi:hypothetical protein